MSEDYKGQATPNARMKWKTPKGFNDGINIEAPSKAHNPISPENHFNNFLVNQ